MKQRYYVIVLIIRSAKDQHELLLARRSPDRFMGGTWQLISGGLEPEETAWQAGLREMREETALTPREFYRLAALTSFYRSDNDSLYTAPMFCAIVDQPAAVRINAEHSAYEWVNVIDAEARLMWASDRQALAEVRSTILAGAPVAQYMRVGTGSA